MVEAEAEIMSKKVFIRVFIILFLFIAPFTLFSQDNEEDLEVWDYICRQGLQQFQGYLQTHGNIDPAEWKQPIESAFIRLSGYSGEKQASFTYAVTGDENFNAACYPGGQFVIHKGTLDILDSYIEVKTGKQRDTIDPAELSKLRESMLAAVIAHELGHFYNRHAFRTFKQVWSIAEKYEQTIDLALIKYSQQHEYEADRTGYLLLQKAGYNPNAMIEILEMLNAMQQQSLNIAPRHAFNVYLTTHPSPHARLAVFSGQRQELHQWAFELEKAFSDIQLGRNLDEAVSVIDKSLRDVPGNVHILKAKAVAMHKKWLVTVTLKNQKLRGIIDMPTFRDDMVFATTGTRGTRKQIPGDVVLYRKAREAYLKILSQAADPEFYSNFAILLAYSPDPNEEVLALKLAATAAEARSTFSNLSNLAMVFYLTGKTQEAVALLTQISAAYDQNYTNVLTSAAVDPAAMQSLAAFHQEIRKIQNLDRNYTPNDFTPLLNLALCLAYTGDRSNAQKIARDYLSKYESSSKWAAFLASTTSTTIPPVPEKKPMTVDGLQVGQSIDKALRVWGKPDDIAMYQDGTEVWIYNSRNAELNIQGGVIDIIGLVAQGAPRADGKIGVGSSRNEIENIAGAPRRSADPYTIYEGLQNLAVQYSGDSASVILLFQ